MHITRVELMPQWDKFRAKLVSEQSENSTRFKDIRTISSMFGLGRTDGSTFDGILSEG